MRIRCQGGPNHRKTMMVESGIRMVRVMRYKKPKRRTAQSFLSSGTAMLDTETGCYYALPEYDKQGNQIFAWGGWK